MAFVQILVLIAALVAVHRPLGAYMARTFTSERHLWPERLVYRFAGIRTDREHSWRIYLRNILAVSLLSVLGLYILQRVQQWLPMAHGLGPVEETQAWNTATSFVTNTNWQSYGGETTMSHLTQMLGMSFQNFISAAVGICVAIVIIRGIARHGTDRLGNFWVDLVRCNFRILLPIAFIGAMAVLAIGS
ncbi:MAG: potassium-transporting ATPase subunit KdpA, partial [Dermabacter sp.]|nr:potassium-transporting ATPase subunit KdpA [Dermabacter sp.]